MIPMPVTERQLAEAVDILRGKGARTVLLFGSAVADLARARDIDLAVEGIPLRGLLEADAAVYDVLRFPTDLVSREENPELFAVVRERGRLLYAEG